MEQHERLSGTEGFFAEGEGFFKTVLGSARRPEVFNTEVVHGLLCMALEKYAMALLSGLGELPQNHTFADLVWSLKQCVPMSADMERTLLSLDEQSDLCSLEIRKPRIPEREELDRLIEMGKHLQAAAREVVVEGSKFPLAMESVVVVA
ncbi:MAG: hypothetical protein IPN71_02725 [Fibrobacteres bacterium]|nr:hypothetical protein [Fibrobacterota bacterium]